MVCSSFTDAASFGRLFRLRQWKQQHEQRTEVTSLERKALSFASSVQRCFHSSFVKFNVVMFLKYGVASIPEKLVSVQTNDSRQTCGLLHWLSQVLPCTL